MWAQRPLTQWAQAAQGSCTGPMHASQSLRRCHIHCQGGLLKLRELHMCVSMFTLVAFDAAQAAGPPPVVGPVP